MKNFIKSAAFKVLAFVALFLVGIMIYAASTGGVSTIPATISGAILSPIQSLSASVADGVHNFSSGFTDSGRLREENEALQSEVDTLRDQQGELDQLRQENQYYKEYLDLKEANPDYKFADGSVIYVDPSNNYGNFTINAGSLKNVKKNDPVITPEGLVGVVSEVGLTYSKVQTILDPATHVTAFASLSKASGITSGSLSLAVNGELRLNYLQRDSGTASGEYVFTSGRSGIYPEMLKIGKVEEVQQETDGVTMYAVIKPFTDIENVTDVFVITSFNGQGESTQ